MLGENRNPSTLHYPMNLHERRSTLLPWQIPAVKSIGRNDKIERVVLERERERTCCNKLDYTSTNCSNVLPRARYRGRRKISRETFSG
jgi:hypothetical protein